MKYNHMVKYNGVYYAAGAEVPADEPVKEEPANDDIPTDEVPAGEPAKATNKRK